MSENQLLENAKRLYYKNKLKASKKLLDECVEINYTNTDVFKYLGLIFVYQNDDQAAFKSLIRAYRANLDDPEVLHALAFLELKDRNMEKALDYWLGALELDPEDKIAKRNMERVRRTKDLDRLIQSVRPSSYLKKGLVFPVISFPVMIIFSAVLFIAAGVVLSLRMWENVENGKPAFQRAVRKMNLEQMTDYINAGSPALFRFDNQEVPAFFRSIKRALKDGKLNQVIIELNRIRHSNLREDVKEKFLLFGDFIPEPEHYKDVDMNINPEALFNEPTLYQGIYLVLDGKIRGLSTSREGHSFFIDWRDEHTDRLFRAKLDRQGRLELREGMQVRVLARYKHNMENRGTVVAEVLKIWTEHKELLELKKE